MVFVEMKGLDLRLRMSNELFNGVGMAIETSLENCLIRCFEVAVVVVLSSLGSRRENMPSKGFLFLLPPLEYLKPRVVLPEFFLI